MYNITTSGSEVGGEGVWCKERNVQYQDGSHLQYEEKVMQYKERVYSIRSASSPVGGQGVWSKEKVCIINNITSAVRGEKVCSTTIVTSAAQGQGCAV